MTETLPRSSLARALAAAQAEIEDPPRAKILKVPGRPERRYAGLDDLLRAVRPVLAKHGIAIVQMVEQRDGRPYMVSRLIHESGDTVESAWEMDWKGGPQDKGSLSTYYRRYALEALVGVCATDDDDAESVQHPTGRQQPQAEQPRGRSRPKAQEIPTEPTADDQRLAVSVREDREKADTARKAKHHASFTDGERRSYSAAVSALGLDVDLVAEWVESTGRPRPSGMEPAQRAKLIAYLGTEKGRDDFNDFVVERAERAARETA